MSGQLKTMLLAVAATLLTCGSVLAENQANLTQMVAKAPTTLSLAAASTQEIAGTVQGVAGHPPTGTITYTATSQQGTSVSFDEALAGGTSSFELNSLASGTYTLSATYHGDSNYLDSSAALGTPIMFYPGQPDFSIQMSSATGTVKQGSTWNGAATVKSLNGFSGVVAMSCGKTVAKMTCNLGTGGVQLSPAGNSTVSIGIATMATTVTTLSGLGMMLFFFGTGKRSERKGRKRLGFAIMSALVVLATGCGVNQRYVQENGTPAGTYTVVITGTSGALVHSQSVQITVQ